MATKVNPFHDLYVGESIGPDNFVELFSNVIVSHALALFQPGHVVLKGLPGTGKSMLLNLLEPSIRIAYNNKNVEFPVPKEFRNFIGAGINLKKSGISDFGQRPIDLGEFKNISPIYFGDFLNYWVVIDILKSVELYAKASGLREELEINYSNDILEKFANALCKDDCWLKGLEDVKGYDNLINSLNNRISQYRSYLNYNINDFPNHIRETKTSIGLPISKAVELLKKFKIIGKNVEVFVRIDQYEDLAYLHDKSMSLGEDFQAIINKLIGSRDTTVSYRIGTRHFAWNNNAKYMYGTKGRLEGHRNFKEISIDKVLRRKENVKYWVFPEFALDIFKRRINTSPYTIPADAEILAPSLFEYTFGKKLRTFEKARAYLGKNYKNVLVLEKNWPQKWKNFLLGLVETDPVSARFGEAWVRQVRKDDYMNEKEFIPPYPWEQKQKIYWRKERIDQALLQIASRNRQQLIWAGSDDILSLSGGNILAFLSICQHIWDAWLRSDISAQLTDEEIVYLPQMHRAVQNVGIFETSLNWYDSITNNQGGKERKQFITYIGTFFYKKLVEDKAMSYPGHNGFSVVIDQLDSHEKIEKFLQSASDYGDLYQYEHTSKANDKRPRIKWYINPILSPYFRLPISHTKEPLYASINDVQDWLVDAGVYQAQKLKMPLKRKKGTKDKTQMTLPLN